ncbi:MAG: glycosyltransferase family 2 protein [Cyclobacteriaceae bacterium]|nr:glycosyltransferase family 2 protein [Cyclobacteriaceae bacterium]
MISLVIPIYNEEQVIDELLRRSLAALEKTGQAFEVIMVDDGSTDGSLQKLLQVHNEDKRVKVLELSRNFGHQAAFTAGLRQSLGDYTVMMDGDLQDMPELIGPMYEKMMSGQYDIVNGYRTSRAETGFRAFLFMVFHKLFAFILDNREAENMGNFSMLNRPALEALKQLKEKTRYLPGLRSYVGFRQGSLDYDREARAEGKAKMRLKHLMGLAADAIFSFSRLPIKVCFYLGLVGIVVFGLAGIVLLFEEPTTPLTHDYKSILVGLYFLGSVQLAFIGIIGEYVFKGYKETQNRPMYFVRKAYVD